MRSSIGKDQKVGYWTIVTNIVLVLTTFWLGLTVQDFVADKNANVSAVLAKVEYVDAVKPHVDSLNVQYNSFLHDIDSALKYWNKTGDSKLFVVGSSVTFLTKMNEITQYYSDLIATAKKVMYYYDDADIDSKLEGSVLAKIDVLYSYKELLEFYFEEDTVKGLKTAEDWLYLKQRLVKVYKSEDYIRTVGLCFEYDYKLDEFGKMYKEFFKADGKTLNPDGLLTTISQSFFLALDIHKILNDNRVYRQKEDTLLSRLVRAPWSILFISIVVLWIIFTIIVFKTANDSNKPDTGWPERCDELEKATASARKETNAQLETIKSKLRESEICCQRHEKEIKESIAAIQTQIDDIVKRFDEANSHE